MGYRTGRGKNATHETKIAYHTDGTEFMRQSMSGIEPDVLVLDEAHGYSVQTEMLAMSIRKAVKSRAMQLVIMSATLDPEIFREYYRDISSNIPLIEIPGRTFGVESEFDREGSIMNDLNNAISGKQNVLIFAPGKKEIQMHIDAIRARF